MGTTIERIGLDGLLLLLVAWPAIIVITIVIAFLFHKVIFPVALRITNRTHTNLDTRLLTAARLPITIGIVLVGSYVAVIAPLELPPAQSALVNLAARAVALAWLTWLVASLAAHALGWYEDTVAPRTRSELDDHLLPIARRFAYSIIYVSGGLLILDQFSVNISPLIAGLGLGGLAVSLALQPTLSNLFAGTYVMTEGVVTEGDYIELENGISGYVVDVGWRSTGSARGATTWW